MMENKRVTITIPEDIGRHAACLATEKGQGFRDLLNDMAADRIWGDMKKYEDRIMVTLELSPKIWEAVRVLANAKCVSTETYISDILSEGIREWWGNRYE